MTARFHPILVPDLGAFTKAELQYCLPSGHYWAAGKEAVILTTAERTWTLRTPVNGNFEAVNIAKGTWVCPGMMVGGVWESRTERVSPPEVCDVIADQTRPSMWRLSPKSRRAVRYVRRWLPTALALLVGGRLALAHGPAAVGLVGVIGYWLHRFWRDYQQQGKLPDALTARTRLFVRWHHGFFVSWAIITGLNLLTGFPSDAMTAFYDLFALKGLWTSVVIGWSGGVLAQTALNFALHKKSKVRMALPEPEPQPQLEAPAALQSWLNRPDENLEVDLAQLKLLSRHHEDKVAIAATRRLLRIDPAAGVQSLWALLPTLGVEPRVAAVTALGEFGGATDQKRLELWLDTLSVGWGDPFRDAVQDAAHQLADPRQGYLALAESEEPRGAVSTPEEGALSEPESKSIPS